MLLSRLVPLSRPALARPLFVCSPSAPSPSPLPPCLSSVLSSSSSSSSLSFSLLSPHYSLLYGPRQLSLFTRAFRPVDGSSLIDALIDVELIDAALIDVALKPLSCPFLLSSSPPLPLASSSLPSSFLRSTPLLLRANRHGGKRARPGARRRARLRHGNRRVHHREVSRRTHRHAPHAGTLL